MKKPLVVITGASSGIGAGIASLFSQSEYPVALLARNLHEMESLNLSHAICIATDVSDQDSVLAAIAQAEKRFGPTSVCIRDLVIAPTTYEA